MMYVIFGLLLSVSVGGFIAMILTSGFRKTITKFIIGIPLALLIGFGLIGLADFEYQQDVKYFNGGYCECGGEWDLFDVEYRKNSGSLYFYKCEECKNVIRLNSQF